MKKFALSCLSLFLIFGAAWWLKTPTSINAQQTSGNNFVGTHLGEGDPNFQAEIMDMLTEKGATPGFPVTIQTYTNSSPEHIRLLGEAAQRNGFFAIVRVDRTCEGPVNPDIFRQIKEAFGENSVIEFGNEVNNRVSECKNYSQYRSNLISIQNLVSQGIVGPSVLDFYNSQDIAANFFKELGQGSEAAGQALYYNNSQYTFANGYGCMEPGATTETCDPVATMTHEIAYIPLKAKGKPYYITEFSLGPTSNKDLTKVKTFIETHGTPEETGALKITPLVFNVCNSQGVWLLYLYGEFYTNKGTKVNPENCKADKNPFYVEPLPSLLQEEPDATAILNDLKSKHYQPVCAASWEFSPEVKADDIEKALLEGQSRTVEGSLDIKDNAPVPYLRNLSGVSLEEYLGTAQDSLRGNTVTDGIVGGPVYKLHTGNNRCEQQVKLLEKIREKCNALQDPTECALDETLPDSDYTPTQLLNEIKSSGISCQKLESTLEENLTPQEQTIRTALRQTELIMNKFYKLGFIVFIVEQETTQSSGGGLVGLARKAFNFLEGKAPTSKQQVVVVSTKLPSTLTEEIESEVTSYPDALHQTAAILTPIKQQQQQKVKTNEHFTSGQAPNAPGQNFIDCSSEECKKPLVVALENLIEKQLDNPADCMPFAQPIYEETNDLKDVGDLSQLEEKYQTTSGDGDLKAELEEQSFLDGVGSAIENAAGEVVSSASNILAKFFSTIEGNDTNRERPPKPKLKMIYVTQWSDQKQEIDNRLSYSFLSYNQVQSIEQDKERYPELSRMTESFLSSVFNEADFAPVPKRNCVPDPKDPKSCQSVAKATVMVGNFHEPGPPSGASQLLYPAKYVVSAFSSAAHKAIQSWEKTPNKVESFLVGPDLGGDEDKEGEETANSCVDSTIQHERAVNNSSIISNGVIQLAMEVSARTCTPVEVLVGILAKEVRGLNYHGANADTRETVITGDPNESICRSEGCLAGKLGSGPYAFTQLNFRNHAADPDNVALYQRCINNLSVTLSDGKKTLTAAADSRIMGHSMCVAAANFWRYMVLPGYGGKPLCEGSNQRSYKLEELDPEGLKLYLRVVCDPASIKDENHPNHSKCIGYAEGYLNSINLYKDAVQGVVNACQQ